MTTYITKNHANFVKVISVESKTTWRSSENLNSASCLTVVSNELLEL